MSDNFKDLFLLSTLILLLLSCGCAPIKPNRVAAVALTAEDVARAAAKQHDPTIIREGSPAYLMLVDGLIEAYPNNSRLLVAGCKAYASYAAAFLEDEDQGKASPLYAKAKHYGFRALSEKGDFQKAVSEGLDEFNLVLKQYKKKDVPALFWTASSWASWINLNLDDMEALADLPMLEATMTRILELDEAFYYGGPHLFWATYLAAKPAVLGGNLEKSKKHFDRAIELGKGRLLTAKVLLAEYYAVRVGDRNLFENTLQDVISSSVDEVPELTLTNVLAQKKAKKMLENADEYFGDLP